MHVDDAAPAVATDEMPLITMFATMISTITERGNTPLKATTENRTESSGTSGAARWSTSPQR